MDGRKLGAGLVVLVCSLALFAGTASARGSAAHAAGAEKGQCTVTSLPSFVAQGEFGTTATVADVIEIGCDPSEYGTGSEVAVLDNQLYSRCGEEVSWYIPNPYYVTYGRGVDVRLDADGNATVALIAGPRCQAGETLITVHELEEPYDSFATPFTVLPPEDTPKGVVAMPSTQIEDAESSAVATVVEAEFPGLAEDKLRIGSEELYARCRGVEEEEEEGEAGVKPAVKPGFIVNSPGVIWVQEDREESVGGEVTHLGLDDDGNVFVLAIGDDSCFPGPSLIEADLESKPFTTETTTFTIQDPKPRNP